MEYFLQRVMRNVAEDTKEIIFFHELIWLFRAQSVKSSAAIESNFRWNNITEDK